MHEKTKSCGNLVIDSFVGYCMNITTELGIRFETNIQIDQSAIPVDDYDLSIIIGNLLDNSINECRND